MKKLVMVVLLCVAMLGVVAGAVAAQTTLADVTFWADNKNINAGNVAVVAEGDNLTITLNTVDGWVMNETHVYVGTSAPSKSSPGQFPVVHEELGGVTTDSATVSLSALGAVSGSTVFIAAQGAIQKPLLDEAGNPVLDELGNPVILEESAWADGDRIPPGKNWAMFFSVVIP